jgi:Fe-S cluster assembly iron-binding protein IscA
LSSEGDQLTLERGVHIQVDGDNDLYFNGSLIINGAQGDSVRIDGVPDAQGAWAGMVLEKATSTFDWQYVSIGEGGSREVDAVFQDEPANVFLTQDAELNIENSTVYGSGGYGIVIDKGSNASMTEMGVDYYGNASGPTFDQP